MMDSSIRDLLDLMEDLESNPEPGDILDFEFGDDVLVETVVVENRDGDLLLEMDFDALEYFGRHFTFEDAEWQGVAEGAKKSMSRAAKGNEKYGKDGMQELAKAGREGASEEELDSIRDKHDKYAKLDEAKYQGREVPLNKPMKGDVKKKKVYVKNAKGNVIKVNFGDKKMRIKKSNPARRKSFRARHNCKTAKDKTTARYWSCRAW